MSFKPDFASKVGKLIKVKHADGEAVGQLESYNDGWLTIITGEIAMHRFEPFLLPNGRKIRIHEDRVWAVQYDQSQCEWVTVHTPHQDNVPHAA